MGKGKLRQDDDDTGFTAPDGIECRLAIGAEQIDKTAFRPKDNQGIEEYGFALTGIVTTTEGLSPCSAARSATPTSCRLPSHASSLSRSAEPGSGCGGRSRRPPQLAGVGDHFVAKGGIT